MAYLVSCSLCGHNCSSEAKACPGCGHDVADEIRKNQDKENEIMVRRIKDQIVGNWLDDDWNVSAGSNNNYIINRDGTWYRQNNYVGKHEFEGSRYYVYDDGTIQLNTQYHPFQFILKENKLVEKNGDIVLTKKVKRKGDYYARTRFKIRTTTRIPCTRYIIFHAGRRWEVQCSS